MKKLLSIILALTACVSVASAQKNTFTGEGQGTSWEAYSAKMHRSGFYPGLYHKRVTLTAAQINGMYASPVLLVAAPGSGKAIAVSKVIFKITRTATAFASGGAAIIQYGSTVNGGGTQAADSTIAATVFTGAAGSTYTTRNGAIISDSTAPENAALYISNATGAFTTGTGTATVDIWYSVLP